MSKKSLTELLQLYDTFATLEKEKYEKFLWKARQRIIMGHKQYGNDWKEKDNLAEIEFEELDIFNYRMLHKCQRKVRDDRGQ